MPETRAEIFFSPSSVPCVFVQQQKPPQNAVSTQGLEMLPASKLLSEELPEELRGEHGRAQRPSWELLLSTQPLPSRGSNHKDSNSATKPCRFASWSLQHSRAAESLCALAFPVHTPMAVSKGTQAAVPVGNDASVLLSYATTGSCLFCSPIVLPDP